MITNFARVMGLSLTVLGILGFLPSATSHDMLLGVFLTDPVHNLFFIISGLVFAMVGLSEDWEGSRRISLMFAAIFGIITITGFWSTGGHAMGMPVNMADNILHLSIATLSLVFGMPRPYLFHQHH